jgi:hypothetical protein
MNELDPTQTILDAAANEEFCQKASFQDMSGGEESVASPSVVRRGADDRFARGVKEERGRAGKRAIGSPVSLHEGAEQHAVS